MEIKTLIMIGAMAIDVLCLGLLIVLIIKRKKK